MGVYTGHTRYNRLHGYGRLLFHNGELFQGKLASGKFVQGEYKRNNGSVFKGTFKANKPYKGTIRYANGDVYNGIINAQWQKNDHGELVCQDGKIITGCFRNDRLEGLVFIKYPSGDYVVGTFVDGRREGSFQHFVKSKSAMFNLTYKADELIAKEEIV